MVEIDIVMRCFHLVCCSSEYLHKVLEPFVQLAVVARLLPLTDEEKCHILEL